MTIRVVSTLDVLERDLDALPANADTEFRGVVREAVKTGNTVARDFARRSAGSHGKLYPRAFSWQMNRGAGLFGNVISGEYGPDATKPQGDMSFEFGSRNQKPHLDLARSADIIAGALPGEVRAALDRLFW